MRPTLVTTANFGPRAHVVRLPMTGWLVTTQAPELIVVDEQLAELKRFPLPSTWRGGHSVTPDLQLAAISQLDHVALIDADGREVWRRPHPAWGNSESESGSCWVNTDGARIWATVPPDADHNADEWWVLDAITGDVLGVAPLECRAAGSHHVPHPDGVHVGLSVGEGQDAVQVYWGRWDGRPIVTRLDSHSRVLVDVRPDGSQYLAMPHGEDRTVTVHAFPSGAVQASIDEADLSEDGDDADGFDFCGGYVTNELALISTLELRRHLVLAADTLAFVDEVDYEHDAVLDVLTPTGRGAWLTGDYTTGHYQIWRLG
jgi:hypothetical protein